MMEPKILVQDLNLYYGSFHALKNICMEIQPCRITAIIGPSGCGKSTLLRTFNRMNDLIEGVRMEGKIQIDQQNIFEENFDLLSLRKKVGMVFQRPNPFPISVFENVAYGPRIHGLGKRIHLSEVVEGCLSAVELWDVLKDRLQHSALSLSGEEQQRLCIARLLAVEPEVLLMDEPCSALDPIATGKIEELMFQLRDQYAIVIVTHNMQQAARVSDDTGFMLLGELVEFGKTDQIFTSPTDSRTNDYVAGKFG
ncbi:MAG: phosphate ABC transporter ATP-binding protein [Chlamydiae bacterium]|nr:phosphate ABC transporter ATP-binding protein [Chlamydiota bacterium]MBI3277090.1 phosphate ABC transporter ATP-binding protein [Chlamydiota bacterium]